MSRGRVRSAAAVAERERERERVSERERERGFAFGGDRHANRRAEPAEVGGREKPRQEGTRYLQAMRKSGLQPLKQHPARGVLFQRPWAPKPVRPAHPQRHRRRAAPERAAAAAAPQRFKSEWLQESGGPVRRGRGARRAPRPAVAGGAERGARPAETWDAACPISTG